MFKSFTKLNVIFCLFGLIVGSMVISRSCGEVKDKVAGADRNDTNEVISAWQ